MLILSISINSMKYQYPKEDFYSKLTGEYIKDIEYKKNAEDMEVF